MIGNKIKALLTLRNKSTNDACNYMGIMQASWYRKINNDTFKAEELIQLAEITGTKLSFVDEKGNTVISFDIDDIKTNV